MWVFRAMENSQKVALPNTLLCSLVLSHWCYNLGCIQVGPFPITPHAFGLLLPSLICPLISIFLHHSLIHYVASPVPLVLPMIVMTFHLGWIAAKYQRHDFLWPNSWTVCPPKEWYINRHYIFVWHVSFSQGVFLSLCPYFWTHSFSNSFITLRTTSETQLVLSE